MDDFIIDKQYTIKDSLKAMDIVSSKVLFVVDNKILLGAVSDGDRLGVSIYQQSYFIRHYLSLYSSANNHLIGELTGLWTACQVFNLGKDGDLWSEFTFAEIEKQMQESMMQMEHEKINMEKELKNIDELIEELEKLELEK